MVAVARARPTRWRPSACWMTARPGAPPAGLIVNPIAGMGGRVGAQGDRRRRGAAARARARRRPVAAGRAERALARLDRRRPALDLAGARRDGRRPRAAARVPRPRPAAPATGAETTAADTRAPRPEMERRGVELLLFAGGDGTARDILDAVGDARADSRHPDRREDALGVFATSPEAAGDVAAAYLLRRRAARAARRGGADVDEEALRAGRVAARLYGVARVPVDRRDLGPKAASRSATPASTRSARSSRARGRRPDALGPGTTTQRILAASASRERCSASTRSATARSSAATSTRRSCSSSSTAAARGSSSASSAARATCFGRGNQQLSPAVIRRVGRERIDDRRRARQAASRSIRPAARRHRRRRRSTPSSPATAASASHPAARSS